MPLPKNLITDMYTEKAVITTNRGLSLAIFFLLSWLFFSCRENPDTDYKGFSDVFYDKADGKLWGHRMNDPKSANECLKEFSGIELDVVYETDKGRFNIRHDLEAESSSIYLEDYLDALENPKETYMWLDMKNLSWIYIDDIANKLDKILSDRNIKDHCIVESFNGKELYQMNVRGFYTSFWSPHVYESHTKEDSIKCIEVLRENLENYKVNAISAHFPMYEFLNKHFPDYRYHLWTNGLEGDIGKDIIRDLNSKENIKVILVDYPDNFLK